MTRYSYNKPELEAMPHGYSPRPQSTSNDTKSTNPPCSRCKKPLDDFEDKKKMTAEFWKNCRACREKNSTGSKRKKYPEPGFDRTKRQKVETRDKASRQNETPRAAAPSPELLSDSESGIEDHYDLVAQEIIDLTSDESPFVSKPKTTSRECAVCADSFPVQDFPSLIACAHRANICHDCFLTWLEQQMTSTTWDQCTCPTSGCRNLISHNDVQTYAPADVFTRFDELSMRSILSSDPNFLYCPGEGCTSGQIHDTTVGHIFRCNACGFRVCTDQRHEEHVPMHEGETCDEYEKRIEQELADAEEEQRERERIRREQEEASQAEVKRSSVVCPGCGSQIQKIGGCDHMTCERRGCGFEFCYRCRAPYRGSTGIFQLDNAAHLPGCRYHM